MASAAMQRGQLHGRGAFTIWNFRVRAGRDQQIGKFKIVAVSRPFDRRGAIGLRRIDIGFLLQQRLDGGAIAVHGRVRDGAFGGKSESRTSLRRRRKVKQPATCIIHNSITTTSWWPGARLPPGSRISPTSRSGGRAGWHSDCANPQSLPAITFSRPTKPA